MLDATSDLDDALEQPQRVVAHIVRVVVTLMRACQRMLRSSATLMHAEHCVASSFFFASGRHCRRNKPKGVSLIAGCGTESIYLHLQRPPFTFETNLVGCLQLAAAAHPVLARPQQEAKPLSGGMSARFVVASTCSSARVLPCFGKLSCRFAAVWAIHVWGREIMFK